MLKRGLLFGAAMGVFGLMSVYVIVSLLPPSFGILVPVLGLAVAIAFFWPRWFDRAPHAGAGRRLLRRLAVVAAAAPAGALAAFLLVSAWPGYLEWAEGQHRQALERRGLGADEVEQRLALHQQRPSHYLVDGALLTAMPGVVASLVTTAAGAILLRPRPTRR